MQFTEFNKQNLNILRNKMNEALREAGIDSLEFDVGNARFSSAEVEFKVNVKIKGAETRSDKILKDVMAIYDLQPNGPDGQVLTGYNSRRHKYPFSYTDKNGRPMKCGLDLARMMFKAAA